MKEFEKDYAEFEEIKKMFDSAGDEQEKDAARLHYKEWSDGITAKGQEYSEFFRFYKDAREDGNEYIDLHDTLRDEKIEGLVASFRKYGVEKFTFSSTWSSAVKTAWLFTLCGCRAEGMMEVNSNYTKPLSSEREKIPAFVFRIA